MCRQSEIPPIDIYNYVLCIHTHMYMHAYTHIYVHTYMHTYTHIHIHTYGNIQIHTRTETAIDRDRNREIDSYTY